MSRDEQERLRDIKDAITAIREHLSNAGETTATKADPEGWTTGLEPATSGTTSRGSTD